MDGTEVRYVMTYPWPLTAPKLTPSIIQLECLNNVAMIDALRSKVLGRGRGPVKSSIVRHVSLTNNTKPLITALAAHLLYVYGDRPGL